MVSLLINHMFFIIDKNNASIITVAVNELSEWCPISNTTTIKNTPASSLIAFKNLVLNLHSINQPRSTVKKPIAIKLNNFTFPAPLLLFLIYLYSPVLPYAPLSLSFSNQSTCLGVGYTTGATTNCASLSPFSTVISSSPILSVMIPISLL